MAEGVAVGVEYLNKYSKKPKNQMENEELSFRQYQIMTNMNCNLSCQYCYEKNKQNLYNTKANIETYILNKIKEEKCDVFSIEAIGGEPFLALSLLHHICEILENNKGENYNNWLLVTSTNGTLMHKPEVLEFLNKYKNNIKVGFSIDGLKEIHDKHRNKSYNIITKSLPKVIEIIGDDHISVKATLYKKYMDRFYECLVNLVNLGFKDISIGFVYENYDCRSRNYHFTEEEIILLQSELDKCKDYLLNDNDIYLFELEEKDTFLYGEKDPFYFCSAGEEFDCLGCDGKIYTCHKEASNSIKKE